MAQLSGVFFQCRTTRGWQRKLGRYSCMRIYIYVYKVIQLVLATFCVLTLSAQPYLKHPFSKSLNSGRQFSTILPSTSISWFLSIWMKSVPLRKYPYRLSQCVPWTCLLKYAFFATPIFNLQLPKSRDQTQVRPV